MKKMDLLTDSPAKLYKMYFLPSICSTLITSVYIIADTVMVGHGIGELALIALNLLLPVFSIFFAIGMLFGIGGGVLMSMANGKGDTKRAKELFTTSVLTVGMIAILIVIVLNLFLEKIAYLLGANEQTIGYVLDYGRILFSSAPVFLFSSCLQGFVRNDRAPKRAMIAVITGSILNVVLDYIFIFVFHWDMVGAIAATVTGTVVTVGLLLTHFASSENHMVFQWHMFRPVRIKEIAVCGSSSFLLELSSAITTFVFNRQILKYLGNDGVVVYGILTNSFIVALSLFNGCAQAAQPVIAHNYGAGKKERVGKIRNIGAGVTAGIAVGLMCFVFLFPDLLTYAFVKPSANVLQMAAPAIRTYFICLLPVGFNLYLANYFQGIGMPEYSFFISLLRGIVLCLLFIYLLPALFAPEVIWIVTPVTEVLTLLAAAGLFYRSTKTGFYSKESKKDSK